MFEIFVRDSILYETEREREREIMFFDKWLCSTWWFFQWFLQMTTVNYAHSPASNEIHNEIHCFEILKTQ